MPRWLPAQKVRWNFRWNVRRSMGRSMERSTRHSRERSTRHSMQHSTGHSMERSTGHSMERSTGHSMEPVRHCSRLCCYLVAHALESEQWHPACGSKSTRTCSDDLVSREVENRSHSVLAGELVARAARTYLSTCPCTYLDTCLHTCRCTCRCTCRHTFRTCLGTYLASRQMLTHRCKRRTTRRSWTTLCL